MFGRKEKEPSPEGIVTSDEVAKKAKEERQIEEISSKQQEVPKTEVAAQVASAADAKPEPAEKPESSNTPKAQAKPAKESIIPKDRPSGFSASAQAAKPKGKKWRPSRRTLLLAGSVLIVVAVVVGVLLYITGNTTPQVADKNPTALADVQEQVAIANRYKRGSDMWTYLSLNAADYASSHEVCATAYKIMDDVEAAHTKIDTSSTRKTVDERCQP